MLPTKVRNIKLYPLQQQSVQACKKSFIKSKKIILKATCGFGKTVIAAYMIQSARKRNLSCLFLVDRIILADQTSRTFDDYGIDHGIYQGQNPRYAPDKPVQIASIQTLARREAQYSKFDLIIIDEVHCFHNAHKKLMDNNPNAFFLGLSATPYTRGLGRFFDSFIEPFSINEMIKNKLLSPYTIWSPSIADLSKLRIKAGEYTEDSLRDTYDKKDIVGDVIEHWEKLAKGKKTIAFGFNVDHIKNIASAFKTAGVKAVQINGYQKKEEKQIALDKFMRGDADILCSVDIAVKGFDYPPVECVMFVLATRSKIKWEQGVGRGLRISPETDKEKAIIIDFGGNLARLGWPDGSNFSRLNTGEKKAKTEEKEPRLCINCQCRVPDGINVCPACGYDLKPLGAPMPEADNKAELEEYIRPDPESREYREAFLGALNTYAEQKKYKKSKNGVYPWSIYKYQEKFKKVPDGFSWKCLSPILPEVMKYIRYHNIRYAKSKWRKHI
jgi:superfamily II DNA or RNA helicase